MAGGAKSASATGKHDEPLLTTVGTPAAGKPAARINFLVNRIKSDYSF
jgi:hypothetical protein